jgi:ribosomal protein L22
MTKAAETLEDVIVSFFRKLGKETPRPPMDDKTWQKMIARELARVIREFEKG